MNFFWDRLGISASVLCIVHCLATPFLVLLAPFAGEFLSDQWFHRIVLILVFPVATWALWQGYRLHRFQRMLWLGGVGLVCMLWGMSFSTTQRGYETVFMVLAGIFLSTAHYLNIRACRHRRSNP